VPHVGPLRQLRDLVRLQGASEVVFAADALTNTAILSGMRSLRDMPVELKILAQHRDRIIGKASVEDLSAPLLRAEKAVAPLRSPVARRALEVPVALLGMALHPLLRPLARRARAHSRRRRLAHFTARMPSVLAGRRALVGYDPARTHPPEAWGLRPGVVSILDTLEAPPRSIVDAHRAYWGYARNESAALDIEILLQALARPETPEA
ncbi:MAG: glycosyl transferase family 2, partial [Bacteroidota bacterium]